jgi:hypothetical protein
MNDMSELPPLGHNKPPLVDPELIAQSKAKVEAFAASAGEWLALGEIPDAEKAGELADYIAGARQVYKRVDEARVAAKKPHDEAAKAVQGMFTPLLDTITRCVEKLKPMQAAWLRKEQERIDAEKAEQRRLADAARVAAEEAAALAAANNSIAGELEAERLQDEAKKLEKEANREVRANVQSASGGGRTMALRTIKKVRIKDINHLYRAYRDRPEVAEVLTRLAEADVRAKGWDGTPPPGTEVYEADSAA